MNSENVRWVLRADGAFNFIAGLILISYVPALYQLIGWPTDSNTPVYPQVLGAATVGLALVVWWAANHPEQSRDSIFASVITKTLVGIIILYHIFVNGVTTPNIAILLVAVVLQVLFVIGEGSYVLLSQRNA